MIKDFNDKRSLSAYSVAPINPNEITTHLLSTIHTYLRHTKGPLNVSVRDWSPALPCLVRRGWAQPILVGTTHPSLGAVGALHRSNVLPR